jgi:serine/threonine protein kinase
MAPEQVQGKPVDTRTDIFALGLVIYEMVTGKKAFEGESKASLAAAILTSDVVPITRIQPLAPVALDRAVGKCLNKDAEERWQNVRDLTGELKWILEDLKGSGTSAAPKAQPEKAPRARRATRLVGIGAAWPSRQQERSGSISAESLQVFLP